ncbi:MAG TPA: ferrochelatase [Verrucomicrobiae bacterium]
MSKAILLVNLGSPDSPSVPDVRRYLNEFLMDARVIDVAWPLRRFIVGMILINRPKESAHAYQSIWTPAGSPLIVTSRNVQKKLQARVSVPVELAMRYQNPSIESAVRNLSARGVDDVLVIPLFPHYAMSSYETAVVRVQEVARKLAPQMRVTVQPPYGDAPDFIAAMVASAAEFQQQGFDHWLFSFHGVPERQIKKSDPTGAHCLTVPDCCNTPSEAHKFCYRHQCYRTAAEFARKANLPAGKWSVAFQSRLGKDPWLKPYTDFELERLAKEGVKKIVVMSPAFVSDCLETIEELGIRGKETFLGAGGESFKLVPCLNEHPAWLDALANMAGTFIGK